MSVEIGAKSNFLRDALIEDGLIGAVGKIKMTMLGVDFELSETSAIGYMLQDWLEVWMDSKNIFNEKPQNSQEPPDFFLSKDHEQDLLEVKCFTGSPGFDISNFDTYTRLLSTKPEHLFADYLVFEYSLTESGLRILELSLLKIWDMTRPMKDYPLNVQKKKQGENGPQKVYNIRPADWRTKNASLPIHGNYENFLNAISQVIALEEGASQAESWLQNAKEGAENYLQRF